MIFNDLLFGIHTFQQSLEIFNFNHIETKIYIISNFVIYYILLYKMILAV
jgi:hypothetical protein